MVSKHLVTSSCWVRNAACALGGRVGWGCWCRLQPSFRNKGGGAGCRNWWHSRILDRNSKMRNSFFYIIIIQYPLYRSYTTTLHQLSISDIVHELSLLWSYSTPPVVFSAVIVGSLMVAFFCALTLTARKSKFVTINLYRNSHTKLIELSTSLKTYQN